MNDANIVSSGLQNSPGEHRDVARYVERFSQPIQLRDGSKLQLRHLLKRDRERLRAFFDSCSAEAIRTRFMSSIKAPSEALLRYLSEADGSRHVALILTRQQGDEENIVAEGRYVAFPDRADTADIAFLVVDEMQRRGIATLLIQKLMEIAARNGFARFSADVLADNWAMVSLIRKTARSVSATVSSGVIHFDIPVIGYDRRMFRAA